MNEPARDDVLGKKLHELGRGKWFRKSDGAEVWVDVAFHPHPKSWPTGGTMLTRLYLNDLEGSREITMEELQRDYERSRYKDDEFPAEIDA